MSWELFEHTADLGLRVRATTLAALFEQAGEGLFAMIAERADGGAAGTEGASEPVELRVDGTRHDWLLHDWLAELLYVFESRALLLDEFQVVLDETGLRGGARGRPFDPARDRALHEVKAITYHGLEVVSTDEGWTAQVIVDI